jgi:hypothetical protein
MFTATKLAPAATKVDIRIGTLYSPHVVATFMDKHTENVSTQAIYQSASPDTIEVYNGQLRGLKQGPAVITAEYTDIMGNNLTTSFTANATYFPFAQDEVKVIKGSGSYSEKNHVFIPGKSGRVGWTYDNPIDISGFKFLVVKLLTLSSNTPNFGVVLCPKTTSNVYHISDLGKAKQVVIDLQNAKYTSSVQKNKPVDLTNIASISITSDGSGNGKIFVGEMFLSNDDQYDTTGITEMTATRNNKVNVYTLAGQLLQKGVNRSEAVKNLPAGIYVIGNKKVIVK